MRRPDGGIVVAEEVSGTVYGDAHFCSTFDNEFTGSRECFERKLGLL